MRASGFFAHEDRPRTWRLLAVAVATWVTLLSVVFASPWLPLRIAAAVLAGLVWVRLFIFYHDYLHGAILQKSAFGKAIMHFIGYWTLSGPSVWRQTHDYHHKHTAKMVGASIGSYPVVTVDMWREMTPAQRSDYRMVRHPLNMAMGYFTVFMLGMCVSPFRRNPRQHYDGVISLALHFGVFALVAWFAGVGTALLVVVLPTFVSSAADSYLFYAQHNFPGMQIRARQDWEYSFAATRSSSMFDMGPVMHWLTGNIGYHHVHHLNHRIPFYRLPEAMDAIPELQSPGRTSWKLADVRACLALKVWDPTQGRMLSFEETEAALLMDVQLSAK